MHPWSQHLHRFPTLPSTNTYLKQLAKEGAPEGTAVIADTQTAGRGRLGRTFLSPAGQGIYLSLLLRPNCPPQKLMHLTCATAVAACDAIEQETGIRPGIKWINDLVLQGRKLAGILTELTVDPASGLVTSAIIGIGINCHQPPQELSDTACALSEFTHKPIPSENLITALIESLYEMRNNLLTNQEQIMSRYRQNCITLGQEVIVIQNDTQTPATALSLDDQGALTVQLPDSTTKTVQSGEVTLRTPTGYC